MPAGGEDDGIRMNEVAGAVDLIESERTEHRVVVDQDPGDVYPVEDRDVELLGAGHKGALDLEAGVIAGERGAPPPVGAEEAL